MITKHEVTARCACPKDSGNDTYSVVIETTRVITVEDIRKELDRLSFLKMYQEDFTISLARGLGARVMSAGEHSGIRTTCTAGEA